MVVSNLTISPPTALDHMKSFSAGKGDNENDECQFLLSPVTELMKQQREEKKKKKKRSPSSACCSDEGRCNSKQLVDYHSLPEFLKHNEFILHYYRSEWPIKDAILSIFSIHNETINVWTHLIGFFIFLTLTAAAAAIIPMGSGSNSVALSTNMTSGAAANIILQMMPSTTHANLTASVAAAAAEQAQATRWPFYAYLCGAMFCLLMSSTCHLLSCHSEHTCYVMLRLDYAGITALIVTSFYPLVYYSFLCHPHFQHIYLTFITVFGAAAVLVSLVPAFERPEFRFARAGLFACMALSGLVPILHKVAAFGDRPEAVLTTGYEAAMGLSYGLGVIVYATRVPERWLPGKFDLAGHSHQLFHVLVIAGAYSHYLAGLVYLRWRDVDACF